MLFAGYRILHPELPAHAEDNRIEVTADDLRQLEIAWTAQWHRPPTPDEMRGLVESRVREEILYREALALGLDQGDTIVKRRLAQKMEFLAERRLGAARSNRRRTACVVRQQLGTLRRAGPPVVPTRVLFHRSSGRQAREDAARALANLAGKPVDSPAVATHRRSIHVPGSLRRSFSRSRSHRHSEAAFAAVGRSSSDPDPGKDPIESGLGWHLVFVTSATPGRVPAYDEIEPEIKSGMDRRATHRGAAACVRRDEGALRDPSAGSARGEGHASARHEVHAMNIAARAFRWFGRLLAVAGSPSSRISRARAPMKRARHTSS